MWHVWERGVNFMERPESKRPIGRPGLRWSPILKWMFESGEGEWIGLIWFRLGTSDRRL
jgi:hypothetical protein